MTFRREWVKAWLAACAAGVPDVVRPLSEIAAMQREIDDIARDSGASAQDGRQTRPTTANTAPE